MKSWHSELNMRKVCYDSSIAIMDVYCLQSRLEKRFTIRVKMDRIEFIIAITLLEPNPTVLGLYYL